MNTVTVTETKNEVTVNETTNTVTVQEGVATVVTVKTEGPQGQALSDGDKGDVTVASNGTSVTVNAGVIDNANIASNAAIDLTKLATGALPTAITVTSANISDLSIVNADINASAAIAGTKIDPDFGSQNIVTTGTLSSDNITISNTHPKLFFTDTNNNPDYLIHNENGVLKFKDTTNNQGILRLNAQHTDFITNVDFLAGIDVTGNISVTGTVDGRDVAADGTKLDGIETSATADQTAAEIKTLLDSNGIVNSNVDASASIAGTKISPNFGSQNVTTSGNFSCGGTQFTFSNDAGGKIRFLDTNNNPDFFIRSSQGTFQIDQTSDDPIIKVNSDKHVDINYNLDVTGDISLTDVNPAIFFTDTNNDSDFALVLNTGLFRIRDVTNSNADRLTIDSSGLVTVANDLTVSGLLTATTQSAGNNTTRVATTAFVSTAIANLVDSSPSTLNTLNELAAALGDDANFSTTVTNSIATKMPLAGGEFTGNITFSGSQTVDGRDLSVDGAKLDTIESNATADQTKSDIDALGIAASTAATLATARTIAGVSFDGSADISLGGNSSSNNVRKITTSTSQPSGGSDGDLWFTYTA